MTLKYCLLACLLLSTAAQAHDHTTPIPATSDPQAPVLQSSPQGFYGVGHAKWHDLYKNMHNQNGGSCCSAATNGECRPTTSKVVDGKRWALNDGVWIEIPPNKFVREYKFSFSDTAHICSKDMNVYCFIPEGPGI